MIVLDIVRNETELHIPGELRDNSLYFTSKGKNSLFPGRPYRLANDGYQSNWSKWYEDLIARESYILDAGWERASFNNLRELQVHLETQSRIDDLLKKYPSSFAETLKNDWLNVKSNLEGRKYHKPSGG